MNAPTICTLENVATCRNILPEGFAEEAAERERLIQQNRIDSLRDVERISSNYTSISDELTGLRLHLKSLSDSYDNLGRVYRENGAAHDRMVEKMKIFSEELRKTAALIRTNLARK